MTPPKQPSASPSRAFATLQYPLPHHLLSRIVHWLARLRAGAVHRLAVRIFIRVMGVDMRDAREPDPGSYPSFNAFFTRALAHGTRPLAPATHRLISPVDGTVSQLGQIRDQRVYQAKGHDFSLDDLLADSALAEEFRDGGFATIYLAPNNYHRIHMPAAGTLRSMHLIPGRLFSVNAATAAHVPRLFARNERVVCVFDGERCAFAMVLVGAMFVGSIETVWAGEVTPGSGRHAFRRDYIPANSDPVRLQRGEEMGRFNMGSTVILLHNVDNLRWREDLRSGSSLRLGEALTPADQDSDRQ